MNTKEKLLAEPVRHPISGEMICIYEFPRDSQNVLVKVGVDAYYPREEVLRIGLGNFNAGVTRIGQAAYQDKDLRIGSLKPLADEARGLE